MISIGGIIFLHIFYFSLYEGINERITRLHGLLFINSTTDVPFDIKIKLAFGLTNYIKLYHVDKMKRLIFITDIWLLRSITKR